MKHEAMTRGHAERLAPMTEEVMADAGIRAADLGMIAVTTGPGSFTGARLGVSFARGLAFALDIPAIGVSVFEAISGGRDLLVALPGKQGALLVQAGPDSLPVELPADTAWSVAPETGTVTVTGPAAQDMISAAPDSFQQRAIIEVFDPVTSETVARIGAEKFASGQTERPAPLYLRPPDAKPQATVTLS